MPHTRPPAAWRDRPPRESPALIDHRPPRETFLRDVLDGLRRTPKTIPCKYLYDARGSALFDAICELPEYYPTRTEIAVMREHAGEMARAIGKDALVIELGSGSSLKTRLLLDHLTRPAGYVLVDISHEHLVEAATSLAQEYPAVEIVPLCADYTRAFDPPRPQRPEARRVAYFPGSTIGNLHPGEAQQFLARLARMVRRRPDHEPANGGLLRPGGLLIGVDLRKDPAMLDAAYNDAARVTAEFNFNLLRRINRELRGDIVESRFEFRANWNDEAGRIESFLISRVSQTVRIEGQPIDLAAGERIRTECSYKYTIDGFGELARPAGWRAKRTWTDPGRLFSVQLYEDSLAC